MGKRNSFEAPSWIGTTAQLAVDFGIFAATVVCFLVAFGWLGLLGWAELSCLSLPSHVCRGDQGDVFMVPFIYGFIGLPATVASVIIIVVRRRWRRNAPQSGARRGTMSAYDPITDVEK